MSVRRSGRPKVRKSEGRNGCEEVVDAGDGRRAVAAGDRLEQRQRPRQPGAGLGVGLVGGEGGQAVGRDGDQLRAAAGGARAEHEAADLARGRAARAAAAACRRRRRSAAGRRCGRCRTRRRPRGTARAAGARPRRWGARARRRPARSSSSSVARARCRALLTEATEVSSTSATSLALQRSTSRSTSTTRWRAGRCWSAATKASRSVSRSAAWAAGSASGSTTWPSAIGRTQVDLRQRRADRRVGRPGVGEVDRPGAALAGVDLVEADVGGDPEEPRLQRRRARPACRSAARRGAASPGWRPRPRSPSRASGSSSRSARAAGAPDPARTRAGARRSGHRRIVAAPTD